MKMTTPSSKKTIKRKLDDSVLKKARAALGLPLESTEGDDEKRDDEPSLKWRKPRHNTTEGQPYVKNKEKRKKLDEDQMKPSSKSSKTGVTSSKTGKDKDDTKKRKNKRKGKKKKVSSAPESKEKNQDGEKRHVKEAVSYLQLWASNRGHWKFEKLKQTCLLKNCLNADLIDNTRFETLLEYMVSIKGAARKATLVEMQSVVTKYEITGGGDVSSGITDVMYDRARQIIQMLADD